MNQPNPIEVGLSIARSLLMVRRPRPVGTTRFDHTELQPVLDSLADQGIAGVQERQNELEGYIATASLIDPDRLSRAEALAYWLNLYNAGAIRLAVETFGQGESSVLRVPGGFSRPVVEVAGEKLSLDAIEHAKVRRFQDPRIHGALVCGSLSCPTLRSTPYSGDNIDDQLGDQMRSFLAGGGATVRAGVVSLNRVFLWYGGDFVNPASMPTFLPASRGRILAAIAPWLSRRVGGGARVEFKPYDWGLACSIG